MITITDLFCGAGGSSTGARLSGVDVRLAVNHSDIAIATHSANHPATEHDRADLTATHPSRYARTDMLWISPECTNHSIAKGRRRTNLNQIDLWGQTQIDPEEERSRATMREVIEFAAYHRYKMVIVENVIDVHKWLFYDDWLRAMLDLGYQHRTLYLNARFFSVPQSRDRWYTVFWRKGLPAPNLDFRPAAQCPEHGSISSIQAWKNGRTAGAYARQYVYVCPLCAREVVPPHVPAADIIDWSLPLPRIGDRKKPLVAATLERVRTGLHRYGRIVQVQDGGVPDDSVLAEFPPFISSQYKNANGTSTRTRSIDDVLPTITTFNNQHQLVVPPFQVIFKNSARNGYTQPPLGIDEPLSTIVSSACQHAIVVPPFLASYYGQISLAETVEPLPTVTTRDRHALIIPPRIEEADIERIIPECGFRMLEPHELKLAMSFPDDYIVLGNDRQQVWQIGNAVCCSVSAWLVRRCADVLERAA